MIPSPCANKNCVYPMLGRPSGAHPRAHSMLGTLPYPAIPCRAASLSVGDLGGSWAGGVVSNAATSARMRMQAREACVRTVLTGVSSRVAIS